MKTVLKMTKSQYNQINDFIPAKSKKDGFCLLGQPSLNRKEIDIVLLTVKQFEQLKKIFKEMKIIK